MTRDEARRILSKHNLLWSEDYTNSYLDMLVDLGLLELEQIDRKTIEQGMDYLAGKFVYTYDDSSWGVTATATPRKLTREGAAEIMDILRKSGFKVTRD